MNERNEIQYRYSLYGRAGKGQREKYKSVCAKKVRCVCVCMWCQVLRNTHSVYVLLSHPCYDDNDDEKLMKILLSLHNTQLHRHSTTLHATYVICEDDGDETEIFSFSSNFNLNFLSTNSVFRWIETFDEIHVIRRYDSGNLKCIRCVSVVRFGIDFVVLSTQSEHSYCRRVTVVFADTRICVDWEQKSYQW